MTHGLAGSNKLRLDGLLIRRGRHADWFEGAVATADNTGFCATNPAWLRWEGSKAESVGSSEEGGEGVFDEDVGDEDEEEEEHDNDDAVIEGTGTIAAE